MSKEANIAAQEHLAAQRQRWQHRGRCRSFAPSAVDHDPAPGQPAGREGFKAFFTELTAAFPDAHIEPAHMVADDENVAVAYTLTGTHEGEFQGIAPTGKKIEVRGLQIGRFENGQIVERVGIQRRAGDPAAARRRADGQEMIRRSSLTAMKPQESGVFAFCGNLGRSLGRLTQLFSTSRPSERPIAGVRG